MPKRQPIKKNKKRVSQHVYLDYASSTPLDDIFVPYLKELYTKTFGNGSAITQEGVEAKKMLETTRGQVAGLLGALPSEIFFTSGATESDNLALLGVLGAFKATHKIKPHIIVSTIEHSAIYDTVLSLEHEGLIELTLIPFTDEGELDLKVLKDSIRENTILVSVMYANNEVGTILPIHEVSKIVRHYKRHHAPGSLYPLVHTDASQAPNYLDIRVDPLGIDLMTLSGSKIYGPKGVGILYKKRQVVLKPVFIGGQQESGLRPGTENVPSIVLLGKALKRAVELRVKESARLKTLQHFCRTKLQEGVPHINFTTREEMTLPNIVHFSIPQYQSEVLVLYLDGKGFSISSRSACKSTDEEISHVLRALHTTSGAQERAYLRVSMGRKTTRGDIVAFVRALKQVLALLSTKK